MADWPQADPGNGFFNSFAAMADNLGAWLSNPLQGDQFVAFSDNAAASAVDLPKAPGELADAAGNAITNTANSTLVAVAPYLLAAGILWVAVEVRRAR